ncbi:peptide deformylase [Erysipelothrix rhusiopathiae]|nr:peptide deformylase [Erysipelothrix rhusiopathiae]MDE8036325.1 peptide deformylase [Erysipelothrix rhusiopathiae]MDE8043509.1 peptide deformylase [Erysipelothrix rhusiopathiae]MDE8052629.1 peptide deformylase [Erysipelothrix rhusiopathiae]MDE8054949.1 peptide deformylase [Erysipelothrix rhusiopathiae]
MHDINMDTIVLDPNPVLREKCEPVSFPLSEENRNTLENMLQYVRDSRDPELAEKYNLQPANGIAAPQIGVAKQMTALVVDLEDKHGNIKTVEYALVNPKIVSNSVKQCALSYGEGCLSIRKDYPGLVRRSQRIKVLAYDMITDQRIEIVAKDILAIVLQHEIDHLNGVLFYDHIDSKDPWMAEKGLKIIE